MGLDFRQSIIVEKKKVSAKNPVLLIGLPGIGFVSKLAADHLVKVLEAEHFATLYSPHFPNQVIALKNGKLKPFTMKFYFKKMKQKDLVILRGDLQPLTIEGQYEVSARVLNYFAKLKGREIIAMAGYALNRKVEKPGVYATSTSKLLLEQFLKLGAKKTDSIVPIVGMAGMVPALSSLYGLKGMCLLVETPGTIIDALGASALIELIARFMGEKIDVTHLNSRALKAQKIIQKLEEQARGEEQAMPPAIPGSEPFKRDLSYIR